ncbi:MAG: hypothetical protein ACSHW2_10695 [Parasphingopyxis sp.]
MHRFLKSTSALTAIGILAISCSEGSPDYAEEAAYEEYGADVAEAEAAQSEGGPDIAPTAAPGVAFNYRYAFRLQNNQIASIQERHAAACEELGADRCRITGMRYRLVNETDVSAMLQFKLDPAIARSFGRDAGQLVTEAEGMLVDAEISGIDEGANIARAQRDGANIADTVAQIEAQLATPGLPEGERVLLTQQLERLRQASQATRERIANSEESLATTPMTFTYGSGDIIPGFDSRTPMREAFRESGSLFFGTIAFFVIALGAIIPWLLLILIVVALVRVIRPVWRHYLGDREQTDDIPA